MQFGIYLDMASIARWDLNISQGVVFAYINQAAAWADRAPGDPEFFNLANGKLVSELPSVTGKRDTMLRHVMALAKAGVIERKTIRKFQFIRITAKGKAWNKMRDINPGAPDDREIDPASKQKDKDINPVATQDREKNPAATGKISDVSVKPISIKNYDLGEAVVDKSVDNSESPTEAAASVEPPTIDTQIARVVEVFVEFGYKPEQVADVRSQRVIREWLALGLMQNRLRSWLGRIKEVSAGQPPSMPATYLEERVMKDLKANGDHSKDFNVRPGSIERARNTIKGRTPEDEAALVAAAGLKPKQDAAIA